MSAWGSPEPPDGEDRSPEQRGQPPRYAQPPADQPAYGQPSSGQPSYGEPPYGQPPYGQPPYGQPAFSQPSFGPPGGPPGGNPSAYQGGYAGGAGMPPMYPPYPAGANSHSAVGRRASMGARFGGLVIDSLIVSVVASLFIIPLGGYSSGASCVGQSCSTNFSVDPRATLFTVVLGIVYSAVLVGLTTQTLGHRAVGIRVVDSTDGSAIGPVRAGLRWLVMVVTGAILTLGYWSPFFDKERRRGWHDKASNSIAVPAR